MTKAEIEWAKLEYNAAPRLRGIILNIWLGEAVPYNFSVAGYHFAARHRMNITDCRILARYLGDAEGNIIWPSLGD